MSRVKVVIDNETYDFDKGITLNEIASKYYTGDIPRVCAKLDNEYATLGDSVDRDCNIEFLTYMNPVGNRTYQKGLMFLLAYAFKELYGYNNVVKMCHPIDKGILIRTSCSFNQDNLNKLKEKKGKVQKLN